MNERGKNDRCQEHSRLLQQQIFPFEWMVSTIKEGLYYWLDFVFLHYVALVLSAGFYQCMLTFVSRKLHTTVFMWAIFSPLNMCLHSEAGAVCYLIKSKVLFNYGQSILTVDRQTKIAAWANNTVTICVIIIDDEVNLLCSPSPLFGCCHGRENNALQNQNL